MPGGKKSGARGGKTSRARGGKRARSGKSKRSGKVRSLVRRNTKRSSRKPKTRSYSYYMNKRFRGTGDFEEIVAEARGIYMAMGNASTRTDLSTRNDFNIKLGLYKYFKKYPDHLVLDYKFSKGGGGLSNIPIIVYLLPKIYDAEEDKKQIKRVELATDIDIINPEEKNNTVISIKEFTEDNSDSNPNPDPNPDSTPESLGKYNIKMVIRPFVRDKTDKYNVTISYERSDGAGKQVSKADALEELVDKYFIEMIGHNQYSQLISKDFIAAYSPVNMEFVIDNLHEKTLPNHIEAFKAKVIAKMFEDLEDL